MRQTIHNVGRHKKFIITSFALLSALLAVLFLNRAWLRSTGATWYANTFYQPTVRKQFDDNIGYVNERLAALGVAVNKHGLWDSCRDPQYKGFGVSLYCEKSAASGKVYDDEQFVGNWQQNTQKFESDLLSKGWKRVNNTDQDITRLLDVYLYQPEIVYKLRKNNVGCSVRIGYNKYDTENRKVFVDEYCYRYVDLFGGY